MVITVAQYTRLNNPVAAIIRRLIISEINYQETIGLFLKSPNLARDRALSYYDRGRFLGSQRYGNAENNRRWRKRLGSRSSSSALSEVT